MYYSDQVIEDVRSANNIVDVISSRVQLQKKGKNFFGLCPFHHEKTPSFSVDPDRQIYYCFSCNKGGNVIGFLMETEKLSFPETMQRLADRAHILLPESSDPAYNKQLAKSKELQKRYFEMYTHAASFFSQALLSDNGKAARDYMQKRSIRNDMVRRFGLGYSYNSWDALCQFLESKGFKADEQLAAGLAIKGKNEGHYDRFRHRIIYPIQDVSGRVLAFGGRAIDDSTPKYLNSPETQFYSKGKNLYGLNLAKSTKEKFMLIVEGYMDLIALSAYGFDNVVAPLGTALTDMQAKLLKRYTDDVIIAFDADAAGQAAALRGLDILEGQGFRVRVLSIPDGKDPDDFIGAKGAPAFRNLIAEAAPLMDYKIASLRKSVPADAPDSDVRFLKGVVQLLARVKDEVERDVYINRIVSQYHIYENSVRAEIDKALRRDSRAPGRAAAAPGVNQNERKNSGNNAKPSEGIKQSTGAGAGTNAGAGTGTNAGAGARRGASRAMAYRAAELFILALLSTDNTLWDIVAEKLPPEYMEYENARHALTYACDKASQGRQVSPGELMRFFSPEEGDQFANVLTNGCYCEDNRRAMEQKIRELRAAHAKRHFRGAIAALENEGLSEAEKARIKTQIPDHMKMFDTAKTMGRI